MSRQVAVRRPSAHQHHSRYPGRHVLQPTVVRSDRAVAERPRRRQAGTARERHL